MSHQLTEHARDVLQERKIALEWVERVLTIPIVVPCAYDATLESRLEKISEQGDRVLRVVANKRVVPERVASVCFDRAMKGRP